MTEIHSNDGSLLAETHEPEPIPYGAVVEIIDPDPTSDGRVVLPTKVLVNGVDVGLIAEDGVEYERRGWFRRKKRLQYGVEVQAGSWNDVTIVTLRLLASRVDIKCAKTQGFQEAVVKALRDATKTNGAVRGVRVSD